MLEVFSNEEFVRFFDEYDFLFDDDDESHGSELTDEDDFRFIVEHNLSDNDDDETTPQVWH